MSKLNKIDIEKIKEVVAKVKSASQAARELGLSDSGGMTTRLRKFILKNKIDISHWTGQLWSKGLTSLEDNRLKSSAQKDGEPFCLNSITSSTYVKSIIIKKKLLSYRCSICDMEPIWNEKELKFQLDHINGIRTDNRLENLRLVCPNCHSQTETFGSKNKKKGFPSRQKIIEAIKETSSISRAIIVLGINTSNRKKLETIMIEENLSFKKEEKRIKKCKICDKQINSNAKLYCSNECKSRYFILEKNWIHGTLNTYKYRGCRCKSCTKANTDEKRKLREGKKV